MTPVWVQVAYLVAGGLLHPGAARAELTAHGAPRQPDRGARGRYRHRRRVSSQDDDLDHIVPILLALAVGAIIGVAGAQRVQMTQMPQLVALFNGGRWRAAALVALLELREIPPTQAPTRSSRSRRQRSPSWSARSASPAH
jgi:NAD(P) transhydrogenase subunit beta